MHWVSPNFAHNILHSLVQTPTSQKNSNSQAFSATWAAASPLPAAAATTPPGRSRSARARSMPVRLRTCFNMRVTPIHATGRFLSLQLMCMPQHSHMHNRRTALLPCWQGCTSTPSQTYAHQRHEDGAEAAGQRDQGVCEEARRQQQAQQAGLQRTRQACSCHA